MRPGVVSIDDTRIAGNASPEVNHEFHRIAREILAEARATDEAEDALHEEARGDALPEQLRTPARDASSSARPRSGCASDDADAEKLGEEPEAQAAEHVPLEFDAEEIVARTRGREG